jgi:hypothetical protein
MSTLIFVAVLYFAMNVGAAYWRYYQFRDDMRQYVRYSSHYSDAQIAGGLAASADSLGLPSDAGRVFVRRGSRSILVQSDYDETVELPMTVRDIHFHVQADSSW